MIKNSYLFAVFSLYITPMVLLRFLSPKFLVMLLVLTSFGLFAQNAIYKPRVWTSDDGLPQNSINTIIQDHNGYLVIGTFSGLVKFDGVRFTYFPYPELDYQRVISLYEDDNQDLWIGTEDNGVFRIKDEKIIHYGIDDGLLGLGTSKIFKAPNGNIYFMHQNKGFVKFDGKQFIALDNTPFLKKHLLDGIVDKNNTLWLATEDGLYYQEFGKGKLKLHPDADAHTGGMALVHDNKGRLLFISQGRGIYTVSTDTLVFLENRDYLDYLNTDLFRVDKEGNYWTSLWRNGIVYESEDREDINYWNSNVDPDFPDDEISSFLQDREGNVWFGTNGGGLISMCKSYVTTISEKDGLSSNLTLCVAEDNNENIWIGTIGKGVNKWDGETIINYMPVKRAENVWSFATSPYGNHWAGTFGQGLYYYDKREDSFLRDSTFNSKLVLATIWDTVYNTLYVGTEFNGLFKRENEKWVNIISGDVIPERIINILPVGQNHLWVATLGNGVFEYNNGEIKHYTEKDGLAGNRVRALYKDKEGYLWIGTYGRGLSLFKDGKWFTYTKENGLYDNLVSAIIEDDFGYFWMSCNRGVFRVSRQSLLDIANGKNDALRCRIFTQSHGMSNTETNGGFQPAVWKRKNGQLVFPTIGGVSIFSPDKLSVEGPNPIVVIEELKVDNSRVDHAALELIKPGSRSYSITFTSPVFHDPELLRFKYRLNGFSDEWINASGRRTAYFTNLSPGDYEFEVIAINSSGKVSKKTATIYFTVNPYIYQTLWFQVSMVVLIIIVILGGFFLRNWQILKRSKELEELVSKKTKDLNSTIAELKISNQNNERMLSIIGHDLRGPVGNIEQLLSLSLSDNVDDSDRKEFVQLARGSATTSYNLLNGLLQWSREDKGLASFNPQKTILEAEVESVFDLYKFQADEKEISLINNVPSEVTIYTDVYMLATMLRNTISNALKFTKKGGTVSVEAKSDADGVTFSINDTGIGINENQLANLFSKESIKSTEGTSSEVGTGLGLLLVKDLVKRHEGKIWAESKKGVGTSIFVFIPKKSS